MKKLIIMLFIGCGAPTIEESASQLVQEASLAELEILHLPEGYWTAAQPQANGWLLFSGNEVYQWRPGNDPTYDPTLLVAHEGYHFQFHIGDLDDLTGWLVALTETTLTTRVGLDHNYSVTVIDTGTGEVVVEQSVANVRQDFFSGHSPEVAAKVNGRSGAVTVDNESWAFEVYSLRAPGAADVLVNASEEVTSPMHATFGAYTATVVNDEVHIVGPDYQTVVTPGFHVLALTVADTLVIQGGDDGIDTLAFVSLPQ